MELILGSNSPRRREILSFFNLSFRQLTPLFDEEAVTFQGDPEHHALLLAEGKSEVLLHQEPHAIILTADTVVYKEGRLFSKPKDEEEAQATLATLAGGWHTVYTAVCARRGNQKAHRVEQTRVLLANLTPLQIRRYHQTLHCFDKAGAYAIQGAGSLIVRRIEGCYYNVVGLPIQGTFSVLSAMGIDLWDHLKPFSPVY